LRSRQKFSTHAIKKRKKDSFDTLYRERTHDLFHAHTHTHTHTHAHTHTHTHTHTIYHAQTHTLTQENTLYIHGAPGDGVGAGHRSCQRLLRRRYLRERCVCVREMQGEREREREREVEREVEFRV
jgi:hypothetical protein